MARALFVTRTFKHSFVSPLLPDSDRSPDERICRRLSAAVDSAGASARFLLWARALGGALL
jgi:hypothetical protein